METQVISSKIAMMVFLPSRLVTIFTLIALIPIFNVSWQVATQIFQIFFPIYIASFVMEAIFREGGIKENLQRFGSKYVMGMPVEFAGVASFALLSFSAKPDEAILIGINVAAVVVACAVFVEAYDHYIRPKLEKIKLSYKQGILVLIGISVFLVFYSIHILNTNPFL